MRGLRKFALTAAAGVMVLGAAACTDDESGSSDTTAPAEGGATTAAAAAAGATTTAGGAAAPSGGAKLDAVKSAGTVRCGGRDDLPGFNVVDPSGQHVGFDAEFCKVIAAAVLGDATKGEIVDVETADRFTALQSGEIDVLVRNTTWTATRDGAEGATFLQPTFYDGQGMMVASNSGITDLAGLQDGVVCVARGTTTEGNVANEFTRLGLQVPEVLPFEDIDLVQAAFQEGRCDGWSSDRSQLTGRRSTYPGGPEQLTILPGTFSKEPLAPAVVDNDSGWAQAVSWAIFATIQAEEFGITQANVDQQVTSTDPSILGFLGQAVEGTTLDPGLGLPTDFAYQVIKQVGNYGEIYDRTIGPLGLDRGPNALWTDGGLLYAPPYR